MRTLLLLLTCIAVLPNAMGEEDRPKTLQELQTEEFLLEGSMWERIERAAQQKKIQCMRAFPHENFCVCLANKIPMAVNMVQYVVALTVPREDLGYDQISKEERKAVDVTIQAREECAAQIK